MSIVSAVGHKADTEIWKMKAHITDKFIKSIPPSKSGALLIRDIKQRGLGVRVTKNGVKSFVFSYSCMGRERRMVIGRYPSWSVVRARARINELWRELDLGRDPLAERIKERTAETVADLWEHYEIQHLSSLALRNQMDQRAMWRDYILPRLGEKRLKDLVPSDIDQLHASVSIIGRVRANRVIEVIRKALNLALRWGYIEKNPAIGVRKNIENPRERYLSEAERGRLFNVLEADDDKFAVTAIKLIALTGARLREVLEARWDEFDLEAGIWIKPSSRTKQRRSHRIPLSSAAVNLVSSLQATATTEYLFPSSKGTPKADLKRPWARIQKAAGFKNVRIHDLRHTFASILASNGTPLAIVGRQLGHTQAQTTLRYSHLYDDPLRQASTKVEEAYGPVL